MAKKTHWLLVFGDGETYEGLNNRQRIIEVTDEGLRQMEDEETKPFDLDEKHLLSICRYTHLPYRKKVGGVK